VTTCPGVAPACRLVSVPLLLHIAGGATAEQHASRMPAATPYRHSPGGGAEAAAVCITAAAAAAGSADVGVPVRADARAGRAAEAAMAPAGALLLRWASAAMPRCTGAGTAPPTPALTAAPCSHQPTVAVGRAAVSSCCALTTAVLSTLQAALPCTAAASSPEACSSSCAVMVPASKACSMSDNPVPCSVQGSPEWVRRQGSSCRLPVHS